MTSSLSYSSAQKIHRELTELHNYENDNLSDPDYQIFIRNRRMRERQSRVGGFDVLREFMPMIGTMLGTQFSNAPDTRFSVRTIFGTGHGLRFGAPQTFGYGSESLSDILAASFATHQLPQMNPISKSKFDSFPKMKYEKLDDYMASLSSDQRVEKSTSCCICTSDFEPDTTVVVLPECQHHFDESCIKKWLTEDNNCCPICRHSYADPEPTHSDTYYDDID